ncbi:hypothetical protein F4780DRAFT_795660 [Xylariomycetidae sp. FL0641]|nr:hypothetical protein F4780DRAFT_795660 [Xylariomycetidae sp. FL0641]
MVSSTSGSTLTQEPAPLAPHPRDRLPPWKFKAVLTANVLLGLVNGKWRYDVSNVAVVPVARRLFAFCDFKTLDLASLAFLQAGAAPSLSCVVVVGRALMAVAGRVVYQGTLSFNVVFAYPHELPLVQALLGSSFALGLLTGPIIGGGAFANNPHATWRWAFYVLIPVSLAATGPPPRGLPPAAPAADAAAQRRPPSTCARWTGLAGRLLPAPGDVVPALRQRVRVLRVRVRGAVGGGDGRRGRRRRLRRAAGPVPGQPRPPTASSRGARLLVARSRRTVALTGACTACAALAYGVTLYYVPVYLAFARGGGGGGGGLGPLTAAAARLLPCVGVFVVAIFVSGGLLPVVVAPLPALLCTSSAPPSCCCCCSAPGLLVGTTVDARSTNPARVVGCEALVRRRRGHRLAPGHARRLRRPALCFVAACCLKSEALEFKKPRKVEEEKAGVSEEVTTK